MVLLKKKKKTALELFKEFFYKDPNPRDLELPSFWNIISQLIKNRKQEEKLKKEHQSPLEHVLAEIKCTYYLSLIKIIKIYRERERAGAKNHNV